MSARLRLDLIVRRYPTPTKITTESRSVGGFGTISSTYEPQPDVDRWTWRLWSGSRVVATSGSQLYSRRIDCARGAEVGAGLMFVEDATRGIGGDAVRNDLNGHQRVRVRILDQRGASA